MTAALLDTNAVSDLMRDHAKVKARVAAHHDPVFTNVIVVGEIRYGLSRLPAGKSATHSKHASGIFWHSSASNQ
jgi:predicted nucleic acid-binding protein